MEFSLEDKIGQMILIGFRGVAAGAESAILRTIRESRIGGVVLTDNETPMGRIQGNVESPEQVRRLCDRLQSESRFPLLMTIDGEGGQIIRLRERHGFPPTLPAQDLGERDDVEATRRNSACIATMLKEVGVNFNYAPVVDLNKNPANPALGGKRRCFSAHPDTVIRHATAFIQEQHREGILCCIKHFPGHGSAMGDSHFGMVDVTDTWSEDEWLPFRRLIAEGLADGVMTAHVFLRQFDPDRPATLSSRLLTGILRKQMGFQGIVITDDINMRAILGVYPFEESVRLVIEAGVDILLNANVDPCDEAIAERTVAVVLDHVRNGRLSEQRIEESFERILAVKRKLGLV